MSVSTWRSHAVTLGEVALGGLGECQLDSFLFSLFHLGSSPFCLRLHFVNAKPLNAPSTAPSSLGDPPEAGAACAARGASRGGAEALAVAVALAVAPSFRLALPFLEFSGLFSSRFVIRQGVLSFGKRIEVWLLSSRPDSML